MDPAPEHLLEYQDHVLGFRLRVLVGGRRRPSGGPLPLARYAALRLRRQALARYYLGLVRASAAYQDGEVFTRLRDEVEGERARLPLIVDVAARAVP